jgi:photosystem II stability/assembly factor-like uncharacterized protein
MARNGANTIFAGAVRGAVKKTGPSKGGLFRLRPGADEWEAVASGLPNDGDVQTITQHLNDPKTLFVGTNDGPYRSTDGGEHWEKPDFPDRDVAIWAITMHPGNPDIIYAGASPVALYRSEDCGRSWRRLPQVISPAHCEREGFDTRVICITINPIKTDEIYVGLEVGGVIHSIDGGDSWTDVSARLMELAQQPHLQNNVGGRQCGHCEGMLDTHAVAISKAASSTALLGVRMGIFRTDDGGANWRDMEIGRFSPLTYCRALIVSPHDPETLYTALSEAAVSTDGSVYRSSDGARTWIRIDHGVAAKSTIVGLAAHPSDLDSLYCITRAGQVIGTVDNGASWREYPLPDGVNDVYAVACY